MRILLVEDHADAREVLTRLLELEGHQVTAAADGREGLAVISDFRPDAAVVDIGLPDMSGYDLARQLRATPIGAKIPMVAMTGFGGGSDQLDALQAGFDRHLVKPVDSDDLLAVLSVLTL
jgi:CheY-like chemotaxis protein